MGIITSSTGRAQRVAHVNGQHPSPERRAQFLYAKLQEINPQPTLWDMVCLATEVIGMVGLMEPAYEEIAKKLGTITYEVHYIHGTDLSSCLSIQSNQPPSTTQKSAEDSTVDGSV